MDGAQDSVCVLGGREEGEKVYEGGKEEEETRVSEGGTTRRREGWDKVEMEMKGERAHTRLERDRVGIVKEGERGGKDRVI